MSMYSESLRAFLKPVVPYLDDDSVSEVMINGPEDVWIERKGRLSKTDARFSEEGLLGAARNMAQFVGRPLSDETPRLDARLPDGSRIHVVLPPIAKRGTTIAIRKFFKGKLTPDALLKFGSLTEPMLTLIRAAIETKLNMMVSGGTGSGKTTLLNILSSLIPGEERILTIEDSAELQLNQEHLVSFESRPADKFGKGEINMGDLLHSALRLRPDRIVVGEVRGGEAFYLMQAMNTGHGGSLSTCHANTPTDTLRRIESLCLMSAVEMPMVAVRAQVASAINLIVCCERLNDGSRKTIAISEVLPLDDKGEYRTQDIFVFTPIAKNAEGKMLGYHCPTGILPGFLAKAQAYGFSELTEEFFDPAHWGLPPPPIVNLGQSVHTRWAPSLRHRESGKADPPEFRQAFRAFEAKLLQNSSEMAAAPRPSTPKTPAPKPPPPVPLISPTPPPPPVVSSNRPTLSMRAPFQQELNPSAAAPAPPSSPPRKTSKRAEPALPPQETFVDDEKKAPSVQLSRSMLEEVERMEEEEKTPPRGFSSRRFPPRR
ncbi:MAG: CpaF family protein [Cystobacterineae bacterium]|nr:CpaF family protein [Cystobacterineae bacterium]